MTNSKLVYSTQGGRICPKCGWPLSNCQCSKTKSAGKVAVPDRVVAKLRMEKKGRGGKTVTVVFGLPANDERPAGGCASAPRGSSRRAAAVAPAPASSSRRVRLAFARDGGSIKAWFFTR